MAFRILFRQNLRVTNVLKDKQHLIRNYRSLLRECIHKTAQIVCTWYLNVYTNFDIITNMKY